MALPEFPFPSFRKRAIKPTVNAPIVLPIEADDAMRECVNDTKTSASQDHMLLAASCNPEITISGEPCPETARSVPNSMCPDLIRNIDNDVVRIINSTARNGRIIAGCHVALQSHARYPTKEHRSPHEA